MSESWKAFHLYYHEDPRRAVLRFVQPVVSRLLAERRVSRFFYLVYPLGGRHVRLRLRLPSDQLPAVAELLEGAARELFAVCPSERSLPVDSILRANRRVLAGAPKERDGRAYPDNSFRSAPYHREVERYGGPRLHAENRDFFMISSVEAIRLLDAHQGRELPRLLPEMMRALIRQAWGFAADATELVALLACRVDRVGAALAVSKADRIYARDRETLVELVRDQLSALVEAPDDRGDLLVAGARRLARELAAAEASSRWRIRSAQIHMTANRLVLTTAEEAYLGRLLWHAARAVAAGGRELWARVDAALREGTDAGPTRSELRRAARSRLLAAPGARPPHEPLAPAAHRPLDRETPQQGERHGQPAADGR